MSKKNNSGKINDRSRVSENNSQQNKTADHVQNTDRSSEKNSSESMDRCDKECR